MANRLTIYFTSDTHGYLYPSHFCDQQPRPMGLLSMRFPKDGNTLIIDGGDTIQGSPLTNLYQRLSPEEKASCLTSDAYGTHPIAAMMNLAGYQFVTLGNHDFNYGIPALLDYLTNLDALCLCANIRDREGRLPIAPYAVHRLKTACASVWSACARTLSAAGRTPRRWKSWSSRSRFPPPRPRWTR